MTGIEDRDLLRQVRRTMKEIRVATPRCGEGSWMAPSALFTRDDFLKGQRVKAASITLFPTGCEHAANGGCTMCGEWSGSNFGDRVPSEFHVAQFAVACARLLAKRDIHWLRIYLEGSFLNDAEIAPEARETILGLASNIRDIRRVTIESRPEHVTDARTASARACMRAAVELEIGIGLEAKSDFVRNVCIGKAASMASYKQALNAAHANGIVALAYVLLKPPFLSEREAIEEAVESTAYAFEIGFDEVYVQAASIHEWSLTELLMLKGLYTVPWLWSVLEVVKRTSHLGSVKIGGLEYFPLPSTVSQNFQDMGSRLPCGCSKSIWKLIGEYNATHDVDLLTRASCSCRTVWQSLCSSVPNKMSLSSRVSQALSTISVEEYVRYKRGQCSATVGVSH